MTEQNAKRLDADGCEGKLFERPHPELSWVFYYAEAPVLGWVVPLPDELALPVVTWERSIRLDPYQFPVEIFSPSGHRSFAAMSKIEFEERFCCKDDDFEKLETME